MQSEEREQTHVSIEHLKTQLRCEATGRLKSRGSKVVGHSRKERAVQDQSWS
jgi:hypothetical protein